jgi:hypothetical protein
MVAPYGLTLSEAAPKDGLLIDCLNMNTGFILIRLGQSPQI